MAELGQGQAPSFNDPKTSIVKAGAIPCGQIYSITSSENVSQSYSQNSSKLPSLLDLNTSMTSSSQQQQQMNAGYAPYYMPYNSVPSMPVWNPYGWAQASMGAPPPPPPPPPPPSN